MKKFTKQTAGLKHGYRSGLEDKVVKQLESLGEAIRYEELKLEYLVPKSKHTYTPDFLLSNGLIIETKGRFLVADRKKHLLVKEQYPDLDIRFVFTNPNAKITKTSKTSYAMWCDKNGFKYAKGLIPEEWINETGA